jgi:hypothetical protein
MKRSKKTLVSTVLAALLLTPWPGLAAYIAVLNSSLSTTITLSNPGGNSGPAGVTICFLTAPKKMSGSSIPQCQQLTAQSAQNVTLQPSLTGATRMIIYADAPNVINNSSVSFTVAQSGGATFSLPFTTDQRFTFDVQ